MKLKFLIAAGAGFLLAPVAGQADTPDIALGETIYQESCRNCHGPTAKGMASFPKLTDQTEEYLVMRLEQYRADEEVGPNSALMSPNAMDLSDEEIAGIAAYIVTTFQ